MTPLTDTECVRDLTGTACSRACGREGTKPAACSRGRVDRNTWGNGGRVCGKGLVKRPSKTARSIAASSPETPAAPTACYVSPTESCTEARGTKGYSMEKEQNCTLMEVKARSLSNVDIGLPLCEMESMKPDPI